MTITRPLRRITLQRSQRLFTDAETFTSFSTVLLESIRDAATREVIRRQLDTDAIAGEDADEVHPQLAADVCQHLMLILELDPKHRVRQRLDDRPFDLDCISLSHRRPLNPDYWLDE
jgi:hypothetical protein